MDDDGLECHENIEAFKSPEVKVSALLKDSANICT
jgi:hypothetical protein